MASRKIFLEVEAIRLAVSQERDALALEIVAELVEPSPAGTPVLTGWARANWTPVLGTTAAGIAKRRGKGTAPTRGDVSRARARQQAAIATLLLKGKNAPRTPVIISNHVPYINRLNNGHSKKSPPGWIERCIARAIANRGQKKAFSPVTPLPGTVVPL